MNEEITLKALQTAVDEWIKTYGEQSFKPGEKPNLGEEMADVLWVLVCLANQTGIDLSAEIRKSFAKKTQRDHDRHQQNEKLK